MIHFIQGELVDASPLEAIILAGGLGYQVNIPVTTAEKLPGIGSQVKLHTHAVYREDSQALYGFHSTGDREFFVLLVENVSGIGPKIAINMMSRMSPATLKDAIRAGDVGLISKCPGIGKKTAERLIIELKDKLGPSTSHAETTPIQGSVATEASSPLSDATAALIALGYKLADADKSVRKAAAKLGEDAKTEAIIREALNS
ncbi:MAG: Holliday junction branch migration protein RuvA [Opitutales bacterium]